MKRPASSLRTENFRRTPVDPLVLRVRHQIPTPELMQPNAKADQLTDVAWHHYSSDVTTFNENACILDCVRRISNFLVW